MTEAPNWETTGLSPGDQTALTRGVWKNAIDIKQHSNDIEMRIRCLVLTLLDGAVVTASVVDTTLH